MIPRLLPCLNTECPSCGLCERTEPAFRRCAVHDGQRNRGELCRRRPRGRRAGDRRRFLRRRARGPTPAGSDGHHCFDANKDGAIDLHHECSGGYERVLPFPSDASRRTDLPFKWALVNWNPHGHIPPGVYDKPHFDVHFVIEPIENVFAIGPGACGPEHVRCDQFALARLPVPANYMHPDFKDVEAVAPAMGNHLIDLTGPEFRGVPFTRTWIYGTYEGRVTFYEEMVTVAYLKTLPDTCVPIKTPAAVAVTGRYPSKSCIRYAKDRSEYTVSLEGFELRQASPPGR